MEADTNYFHMMESSIGKPKDSSVNFQWENWTSYVTQQPHGYHHSAASPQFKFKQTSGKKIPHSHWIEIHLPSNFSVKFDIQKLIDTLSHLIHSDLEVYASCFDHHSKIVVKSEDLHWQILSM